MKKYSSIVLFLFLFSAQYAQEEKYIGLFIYNFTKFFDWPANSKQGDFIIEVLGHKSVYEELTAIAEGKSIGSQKIKVINVSTLESISYNHILFVGYWHSRYLPQICEKSGNKPMLLVSEMDGLLEKGSDINFVIKEGKIKFEMSTRKLLDKQLKTDPRIKELAYRVVD